MTNKAFVPSLKGGDLANGLLELSKSVKSHLISSSMKLAKFPKALLKQYSQIKGVGHAGRSVKTSYLEVRRNKCNPRREAMFMHTVSNHLNGTSWLGDSHPEKTVRCGHKVGEGSQFPALLVKDRSCKERAIDLRTPASRKSRERANCASGEEGEEAKGSGVSPSWTITM